MKRFIDFLIEAAMSRTDALKILGLQASFTDDQLKAAYKKAAVANHPDKGGDLVKMQQINVARDVLLNPTSTTSSGPSSKASQKYRDAASSYYTDDEDEYEDDLREPSPQKKNVAYTIVLDMFRTKLNAETRTLVSKMIQIRIPLISGGGKKEYLVLVRKKHIFWNSYAYYANGIYEERERGGRLHVTRPFYNTSSSPVWESHDSIVWLIKELEAVTKLKNVSDKKVTDIFIKYMQNMTKIDKNIR